MKKAGGEIKRRKRVIPASLPHHNHTHQQQADRSPRPSISLDNSEQFHTPTSHPGSVSPSTIPLPSLRQHQLAQPHPNGSKDNTSNNIAPPLPVDFTTYRPRSPADNTLPPLVNFPLPESILNDRKRSYDEAIASSPDDSISSGGGPHHRPRLAPPVLDPDNIPRSVAAQEEPNNAASVIDPNLSTDAAEIEKKAMLMKEVERISNSLAAVKAELAAIQAKEAARRF
jgi:hypothetical protein